MANRALKDSQGADHTHYIHTLINMRKYSKFSHTLHVNHTLIFSRSYSSTSSSFPCSLHTSIISSNSCLTSIHPIYSHINTHQHRHSYDNIYHHTDIDTSIYRTGLSRSLYISPSSIVYLHTSSLFFTRGRYGLPVVPHRTTPSVPQPIIFNDDVYQERKQEDKKGGEKEEGYFDEFGFWRLKK